MSTEIKESSDRLKRKAQASHTKVEREGQDSDLRGTFAAVMLLGGFLAVTWIAVFILFMSRQ